MSSEDALGDPSSDEDYHHEEDGEDDSADDDSMDDDEYPDPSPFANSVLTQELLQQLAGTGFLAALNGAFVEWDDPEAAEDDFGVQQLFDDGETAMDRPPLRGPQLC